MVGIKKSQRYWSLGDWLGFGFPVAGTALVFGTLAIATSPPERQNSLQHSASWNARMSQGFHSQGESPSSGEPARAVEMVGRGPAPTDSRSPNDQFADRARARRPAFRAALTRESSSPESARAPSQELINSAPGQPAGYGAPRLSEEAARSTAKALGRIAAVQPFNRPPRPDLDRSMPAPQAAPEPAPAEEAEVDEDLYSPSPGEQGETTNPQGAAGATGLESDDE